MSVASVWCDAENVMPSNDPIDGQLFATNVQKHKRPELRFLPVKQNSTIKVVLTTGGAAGATRVFAIDGVLLG